MAASHRSILFVPGFWFVQQSHSGTAWTARNSRPTLVCRSRPKANRGHGCCHRRQTSRKNPLRVVSQNRSQHSREFPGVVCRYDFTKILWKTLDNPVSNFRSAKSLRSGSILCRHQVSQNHSRLHDSGRWFWEWWRNRRLLHLWRTVWWWELRRAAQFFR